MKNLQIFNNQEFGEVRILKYKGKIHAAGVDIARSLEYVDANRAIRDHCRGGVSYPVIDSLGRTQDTKIIPEGDIYRLIIKAADQSKNPEIKAKAEKFEKWLFDEVLPSIRKTGSYSTKPGHFPWLDALGPALLKDERMGKGLPRIEQLRLRAALLREAQEETGFDYTKVIAHIESGAQSYEEKAKLAQSKADAKKAKEDQKKAALEADPAYRQSMKTLVWIREEYARCGEDFAFEKNGYLHIRPALVSEWAIKNRIDKPMVLKELIRRGDLRKGNDGRSTVPTRINKEVTVRTIGIKCEAVKNAVCLEGVTQESVL